MKKFGRLLAYLFLLALLFYGLKTIFTGGLLELMIIGAAALLTLLGFIHWNKSLGERLFLFVGLLSMSYLAIIWYFREALYLTLLLISLVLLLLAFPKKPKKNSLTGNVNKGNINKITSPVDDGEPTISEQPHSVVFEPPKARVETEAQSKKELVVKHFSPGLYVASSQGEVYHAPTCNWAKKVGARRQVWLQNKDDAKGKGYQPHGCVS